MSLISIRKDFLDAICNHHSIPIAILFRWDFVFEVQSHPDYSVFEEYGVSRETFMGLDMKVVEELDVPYKFIFDTDRKSATCGFWIPQGLNFQDEWFVSKVLHVVEELRWTYYTKGHVITMNKRMKEQFWDGNSHKLLNRMVGVDGVAIDRGFRDGYFEVAGG